MNKNFAFALLLVSPAALAESGGYLYGGPEAGWYESDDSEDFRLKTDPGVGYHLGAGFRFSPGINLEATYREVEHQGGDVYFRDRKIATFNEDLQLSDLRIGLYYAPPVEKVVSFRVGASYVKQTFQIDFAGADEVVNDGGIFEGGIVVKPAQFITLEAGGGLLLLKEEDEGDSTGIEVRAAAMFHFGAFDIGLGGRYTLLNTEYEDDFDLEETTGAIHLTIGGAWGFPGEAR